MPIKTIFNGAAGLRGKAEGRLGAFAHRNSFDADTV
jgi:hypothetical protein